MSKTVLFQGDSITDCGRDRENPNSEGHGYPLLIKAELGESCPLDYTFLNRGISGNRIVDVYARIKADIINLKPDYMSLLIGVNDVWHEINWQNGVDTDKFEKIYSMLIEEVKTALPDIKIFLIAPYVIEGASTVNCEQIPNRWELFRTGVDEKINAVKRVGKKFDLPVVELQPVFDEACKRAENAHWSADGVHPTAAGHALIKNEWLKAFEAIK